MKNNRSGYTKAADQYMENLSWTVMNSVYAPQENSQ